MSDLSKAIDTLEDLIAGKIDFNGFKAGEAAILDHRIAQANETVRPFLEIALDGLKAGASKLVGAGETALGPLINSTSDSLATLLLNTLSAAGVPTGGAVLSVAEHAALVAVIDGLKAQLDRMHIDLAAPSGANTAPIAAAA